MEGDRKVGICDKCKKPLYSHPVYGPSGHRCVASDLISISADTLFHLVRLGLERKPYDVAMLARRISTHYLRGHPVGRQICEKCVELGYGPNILRAKKDTDQ